MVKPGELKGNDNESVLKSTGFRQKKKKFIRSLLKFPFFIITVLLLAGSGWGAYESFLSGADYAYTQAGAFVTTVLLLPFAVYYMGIVSGMILAFLGFSLVPLCGLFNITETGNGFIMYGRDGLHWIGIIIMFFIISVFLRLMYEKGTVKKLFGLAIVGITGYLVYHYYMQGYDILNTYHEPVYEWGRHFFLRPSFVVLNIILPLTILTALYYSFKNMFKGIRESFLDFLFLFLYGASICTVIFVFLNNILTPNITWMFGYPDIILQETFSYDSDWDLSGKGDGSHNLTLTMGGENKVNALLKGSVIPASELGKDTKLSFNLQAIRGGFNIPYISGNQINVTKDDINVEYVLESGGSLSFRDIFYPYEKEQVFVISVAESYDEVDFSFRPSDYNVYQDHDVKLVFPFTDNIRLIRIFVGDGKVFETEKLSSTISLPRKHLKMGGNDIRVEAVDVYGRDYSHSEYIYRTDYKGNIKVRLEGIEEGEKIDRNRLLKVHTGQECERAYLFCRGRVLSLDKDYKDGMYRFIIEKEDLPEGECQLSIVVVAEDDKKLVRRLTVYR